MLRLRTAVIAAFAAALVAACVLPAAQADRRAPASHAGRSCGTGHAKGVRLAVRVERGHVRCRTARTILRRMFSGGGKFHPGPSNAQSYTQIGKWRCGVSTGIGSCIRHGKRFDTARDWITADAR